MSTATELARSIVTARLHRVPEVVDLVEEAVPDSSAAVDVIVAMADLVIGRNVMLAGVADEPSLEVTRRLWAAQAACAALEPRS